jgi:hypothetical protein
VSVWARFGLLADEGGHVPFAGVALVSVSRASRVEPAPHGSHERVVNELELLAILSQQL